MLQTSRRREAPQLGYYDPYYASLIMLPFWIPNITEFDRAIQAVQQGAFGNINFGDFRIVYKYWDSANNAATNITFLDAGFGNVPLKSYDGLVSSLHEQMRNHYVLG